MYTHSLCSRSNVHRPCQCCELSWQLRGWCGKRQVDGAKIALQHNVGLGGAVVCTVYRRGFGYTTPSPASKLGYVS